MKTKVFRFLSLCFLYLCSFYFIANSSSIQTNSTNFISQCLANRVFKNSNQIAFNQSHINKLNLSSISDIKDLYIYTYHSQITTCIDSIGQDFEPFLNSILPAGISAASYGFAFGIKFALGAGIMKTGLFGLLKATGATIFSVSALPVVITGGILSYAYYKYNQDEIKSSCIQLTSKIQQLIKEDELCVLKKIKENRLKQLQKGQNELKMISQRQKQMNKFLFRYNMKKEEYMQKGQMLKKYFEALRRMAMSKWY